MSPQGIGPALLLLLLMGTSLGAQQPAPAFRRDAWRRRLLQYTTRLPDLVSIKTAVDSLEWGDLEHHCGDFEIPLLLEDGTKKSKEALQYGLFEALQHRMVDVADVTHPDHGHSVLHPRGPADRHESHVIVPMTAAISNGHSFTTVIPLASRHTVVAHGDHHHHIYHDHDRAHRVSTPCNCDPQLDVSQFTLCKLERNKVRAPWYGPPPTPGRAHPPPPWVSHAPNPHLHCSAFIPSSPLFPAFLC
jgi:hypothetical protein